MDIRFKTEPFITLANILRKPLPQEIELCACKENPWFISEDIRYAIDVIIETLLDRPSLEQWLETASAARSQKNVLVVMAGNIPLAGFYDMMCVVISGHSCYIKPSSKDRVLMEFVVQNLLEIDATLPIHLANESTEYDALIFSGSDAAAQIYKSRHGNIPMIMRTSRFSVAVLDGSESTDQLRALGDDVFRYFGLGCRNVSMIFVPEDFDVHSLFSLAREELKSHRGFQNNYRVARALELMNNSDFVDFETFMLKEADSPSNHLCQLSYSRYQSKDQLRDRLADNKTKIQCIVSADKLFDSSVQFGHAQRPLATDFADGIDVLEFLSRI